jgi:uncharacterized protein YraI
MNSTLFARDPPIDCCNRERRNSSVIIAPTVQTSLEPRRNHAKARHSKFDEHPMEDPMRHIYRRVALALFVATLPLPAIAQEAFTLRDVDVFAGPSSEYPPVAELPPGTQVQLAGCLSDWSWCDVMFANDRGWVYAGDLGYPYQGTRVVIIENGPRLRLRTVTFVLDNYWSAHYRSRPWFGERTQWASRVHVEANRGGPPPHGRQAQGRPEGGGGQAAQRAQPQAAQPAQPPDQARRAQPAQPQGSETMRSDERAAKQQPQRPQPEAGHAPQGDQREQRARPSDENRAPPQGMQQQQQQMQAPDRDAQKGRQPEAMQQQAPQARESAKGRPEQAGEQGKGRQPEGAQGQEQGKRSEGKDRERPKEEGQ